MTSDGEFAINNGTQILYPENNEKMQRNAQFLAGYLKEATGTDYVVEAGVEGKGNILLCLGLEGERLKPIGWVSHPKE